MNFIKDESGQCMVESALIVSLIAIVVIVALSLFGPAVVNKLNNASSFIESTTQVK
jgi:Flp pilus assembly pilin Flp